MKSLCRTGKKEYATREDAERDIANIAKGHTGTDNRIPQVAYECTYCFLWHSTSNEARQRKIPGKRVRGAQGKVWKP